MPLRDCATDPTCGECRKTNHELCKGCIGCGCLLSARFATWANGPTSPLITED